MTQKILEYKRKVQGKDLKHRQAKAIILMMKFDFSLKRVMLFYVDLTTVHQRKNTV